MDLTKLNTVDKMNQFRKPDQPFFEEEEKPEKRHLPEFVFLEGETQGNSQEKSSQRKSSQETFGGFQSEFQHTFPRVESKGYPFALRVASFFSALILLLGLVLALPFLLLFVLVNLFTFFQLKPFLERTRLLWSLYKKLFVVMIGFTFGVVSPDFGLAVVIAYLILRGQQSDQQWIGRIMSARFYQG